MEIITQKDFYKKYEWLLKAASNIFWEIPLSDQWTHAKTNLTQSNCFGEISFFAKDKNSEKKISTIKVDMVLKSVIVD